MKVQTNGDTPMSGGVKKTKIPLCGSGNRPARRRLGPSAPRIPRCMSERSLSEVAPEAQAAPASDEEDAQRAPAGEASSDEAWSDEAPFRPSPSLQEAFADFVAVVRRLRRDCPWDREQTHASTRHLTLEEAYEVAHAIDAEDWDELEGELGDLLLHGLFHSRIAEEAGRFTLESVLRRETKKLVRRHPHVFGEGTPQGDDPQGAPAETADDVKTTWEAAKRAEREAADEDGPLPSALDGVPDALPALLKAERTQQKAAAVGVDAPSEGTSWETVEEKLHAFRQASADGAPLEEHELGDLLFALVGHARREGLVAENALRGATERFARRFRQVEQHLDEHTTPAEMKQLWAAAKKKEGEEA